MPTPGGCPTRGARAGAGVRRAWPPLPQQPAGPGSRGGKPLCLCPEVTNWGPCAPPRHGSGVYGWLGAHSPGQGCALLGRVTGSLCPREELRPTVPRKRRWSGPHPAREAPDILLASGPPRPWTAGLGGRDNDEVPAGWSGRAEARAQGRPRPGWRSSIRGAGRPHASVPPDRHAALPGNGSWCLPRQKLPAAARAALTGPKPDRSAMRSTIHLDPQPLRLAPGQGPGWSKGQARPGPASSRNFLPSFSPQLNHGRPPQPCPQALGCSPPDPGSSRQAPSMRAVGLGRGLNRELRDLHWPQAHPLHGRAGATASTARGQQGKRASSSSWGQGSG